MLGLNGEPGDIGEVGIVYDGMEGSKGEPGQPGRDGLPGEPCRPQNFACAVQDHANYRQSVQETRTCNKFCTVKCVR